MPTTTARPQNLTPNRCFGIVEIRISNISSDDLIHTRKGSMIKWALRLQQLSENYFISYVPYDPLGDISVVVVFSKPLDS